MSLIIVFFCILLMILLTARWSLHPFIAFLITALVAGVALGMPIDKIPDAIEKGMGGMLGSLTAIIALGAMFGKIIADSGAAQQITASLMKWCGQKYLTLALMLTGFFVGIPLFYNVGFVLLVPLVFSVARQTGLSAVYLGIPLLASLSVTHGFLPPHPAPTALVPLFHASLGRTLSYGLLIAIPTMLLAGPFFARWLRNIPCSPLAGLTPNLLPEAALPGAVRSFTVALLPVVMLTSASALESWASGSALLKPWVGLAGNPLAVMLVSLLAAAYWLGISRGQSIKVLTDNSLSALKEVSVILLIIAGAGALKQVFSDSGVSDLIAAALSRVPINPLLLGWLMALVIRISLGSATVAGLTAAGIMAPLVIANPTINPDLMVLAIGAGSLMCSHVNDSGFWMFKEYFNLTLKQTFASWTAMETLVGVCGIVGVLILDKIS